MHVSPISKIEFVTVLTEITDKFFNRDLSVLRKTFLNLDKCSCYLFVFLLSQRYRLLNYKYK